MPLMPVLLGGKLRLVNLPQGASSRDQYRAQEENLRRIGVAKCRSYYDGAQYDERNRTRAELLGIDLLTDRLPEHERVHAYATQLAESIDFVADQIAESFALVCEADEVQTILEDALRASDQFSGQNDSDDVAIDDVLRDALIGGDVAVEVRWNPIDGVVFYDVWESEQVEFRYVSRRTLESVARTEVVWRFDGEVGWKQVVERIEFSLRANDFGEQECVRETFWDDEEAPQSVEWLALPFIPWVLLKGESKSLRATRGESLITEQCMEHVDRYNANEQLAYLVARYNSHGNLAVIGDAANLKAEQDGRVSKDVADVLVFPGGTALEAITLPTDPTMIEHQRKVLAEAIYQTFGLTRVDGETINGLGGISGYALEILNRKTEGTFRRIRRNFGQSLRSMFSMTLDVAAYRQQQVFVLSDGSEVADLEAVPLDEPVFEAFWTVDPQVVFPKRGMEIRLGSGYIVDEAMTRDDFVSKLISREEGLRQRGYSDEAIAKIVDEIDAAAPPQPEIGAFATSTAAGSTVGKANRGGA